jgi:Ca2+-transporting ATPase
MRTDVRLDRGTQRDDDGYSRSPASVAETFGVDPARGLTAAAADRLRTGGPNALPEGKAKPGWLRFLDEYRSYIPLRSPRRSTRTRPARSR